MDDVQLQLAQKRIPKCAGVALCGLDTDKNVAVLKGQYVSRTRLSEKLSMQERHPPIGNYPNENFARLAQVSLFRFAQHDIALGWRPVFRLKIARDQTCTLIEAQIRPSPLN